MEKNEFFYPIYDEPVVIQTNVNTTYAAVGIPKRYYDMFPSPLGDYLI